MKRSPVKLKTGFSVEHSRFIEYLFLYEFEGLSQVLFFNYLRSQKREHTFLQFLPMPVTTKLQGALLGEKQDHEKSCVILSADFWPQVCQ